MTNASGSSSYDFRLLGVVLVLGLIHGLIYVFLVPPWQHYDEPNHFEYVWLTAHRPGLPKPGDRDPALSHEVVASMLANGFYKGMDYQPDLNSPNLTITGYSQLFEPPLYYLVASLPLRLLGGADIESQLYAARLVSLFFLLLTILAAWGVISELTSAGNPLRWLVPLFLVFLPGFVDLMTAVNDSVIAIALFSLFIWGSVRLIRRGFSVGDFLWVIITAVACLFAKNMVFIALPLAFVVILIALLRGSRRRLAWGALALGAMALLGLSLSWGDAALWYRSTAQSAPTQASNARAVLGEHVIRLDAQAKLTPRWLVPLFQPVPPQEVRNLGGQTVTLGAWIWASEPVKARTPLLSDGLQTKSQAVDLTKEPVFHAITMTLTTGNTRLWVSLDPKVSPDAGDVKIFYDGIVLALGQRPLQDPPSFSDNQGKSGQWGGEPFVNLIRNGSGETAGIRLRSWIDDLGARFLPDNTRPSLILTSLLDWRSTGWFYRLTAERLLRTFWATFGWGNVALMAGRPYLVLALFTLLGLAGAALAFWRKRKQISWDQIFVLGLFLLIVWLAALVRSSIYLGVPHMYIPVARYVYPAIIPTAIVLCLGWLEIFRLINLPFQHRLLQNSTPNSLQFLPQSLRLPMPIFMFTSLFLVLDVFSILSIHNFYLH